MISGNIIVENLPYRRKQPEIPGYEFVLIGMLTENRVWENSWIRLISLLWNKILRKLSPERIHLRDIINKNFESGEVI